MPTVVGQIAFSAFHQTRIVEVLADTGVILADVGLDVAFGVALTERQHVGALEAPALVPGTLDGEFQRIEGALGLGHAQRGGWNHDFLQGTGAIDVDVGRIVEPRPGAQSLR